MVKAITNFKCEICNRLYENIDEAQKCENQEIPKLYPIGMIYGTSFCGNQLVFCVAEQHVDYWDHAHHYSSWAWRDTNMGDNDNKNNQFCGLESWDSIEPPNKNSKAFKRAIKFLKLKGIKPILYKGKE